MRSNRVGGTFNIDRSESWGRFGDVLGTFWGRFGDVLVLKSAQTIAVFGALTRAFGGFRRRAGT